MMQTSNYVLRDDELYGYLPKVLQLLEDFVLRPPTGASPPGPLRGLCPPEPHYADPHFCNGSAAHGSLHCMKRLCEIVYGYSLRRPDVWHPVSIAVTRAALPYQPGTRAP